MTFRLGVALAVLLVLVGGILLLRPGPLPAPREADVVSTLVAQFIAPLGDVPVASAASDCRTEGETRASLPAELFEAFLAANANAEAFDLTPFAGRLRVVPADAAVARRDGARTLVSVSRAGLLERAALACVEVFGRRERGFFVVLERRPGEAWTVARELTAWEVPEEPAAGPSAPDEPLFLPRPSQLERELRER